MTHIPCLFGILNITTDSFSDGGAYLDSEKALEQARTLHAGGAEVIDMALLLAIQIAPLFQRKLKLTVLPLLFRL